MNKELNFIYQREESRYILNNVNNNKIEYTAYFLSKIIETIIDNYYYDVTYENLYDAAIKGMVDILDEYSIYTDKTDVELSLNEHKELSDKAIKNLQTVTDYDLDECCDDICKLVNYKATNIKIIKISAINSNSANELERIIQRLNKDNIKKVIIDLRDNTGGIVDYAVDICNLLVCNHSLFMSRDKNNNCKIYQSCLINKPFDEIVILTNGKTMSSAEAIALALQEDGNIVIGQKTYGKGVSQKTFNIYGGGILKITSKEYFKLNGESINNNGVIPDINVDCLNTNSKDEILLKAIIYLTNNHDLNIHV